LLPKKNGAECPAVSSQLAFGEFSSCGRRYSTSANSFGRHLGMPLLLASRRLLWLPGAFPSSGLLRWRPVSLCVSRFPFPFQEIENP
jgi:hypothetical protein